MNRKTMKIVAATAMSIFTLFSVFSATIAWFEMVRNVDSTNNDLGIKVNEGLLESITYHKLLDVNGKTMVYENGESYPSQYRFDKTPIGTLTYDWESDSQTISYAAGYSKFDLDDYTTLDQEHPIMLIFTLKEEVLTTTDSLQLMGHTTVNHYLGEKLPSGDPLCSLVGSKYDSGAADANEMIRKQEPDIDVTTGSQRVNGNNELIYKNWFPLSSIARFQYAELSENTYEGELSLSDITTDSAYQFDLSLNEANSELKNGNSFVAVDNDLDTDSFEKDITIYSSSNGKHVKRLAVVIDYYADAIEYIYSTFLGNSILEEDYKGILGFICDWNLEF